MNAITFVLTLQLILQDNMQFANVFYLQKSQELGEKLEYSLRQSEENFTKAQSTIVQLQESKENLENKNRDLEAKLFELIEKEQSAEERARYFVTHFDKKIHIDLHYKDKISPS